MNWLRLSHRPGDDSTRRRADRRRPIVAALEGRPLLSGTTVTSQAIQGNQIGVEAVQVACLGQHDDNPDLSLNFTKIRI
jgi:hypothetical protein